MRRIKINLMSTAILAVIIISGCGKEVKEEVIARVDGEVITVNDVKQELERLRRKPTEADVKRAVNKLVQEAKFIAEAKNRKLHKTEEYKRNIESYKKSLLIRMLNNHLTKQISETGISEEDLKKYYEKNKNLYRARKTFIVNHVTAANKKLAKQVLREMKIHKKDLRTATRLVMAKNPAQMTLREREYIELPSARYGVDFTRSIEKLKNGSISPVIKGSDSRYHIVQVLRRRDIPERSFEKVKDNIKARLRGLQRSKSINKLRKEISDKYKATIYTDKIKKLVEQPAKKQNLKKGK